MFSNAKFHSCILALYSYCLYQGLQFFFIILQISSYHQCAYVNYSFFELFIIFTPPLTVGFAQEFEQVSSDLLASIEYIHAMI